jgi:hypothetical protein
VRNQGNRDQEDDGSNGRVHFEKGGWRSLAAFEKCNRRRTGSMMMTRTFNLSNIRWRWVIGAGIASKFLMPALMFPYMVVYSYFIHPGETEAFYQQYVLDNRVAFSLWAGIPLFFAHLTKLVSGYLGSLLARAQVSEITQETGINF